MSIATKALRSVGRWLTLKALTIVHGSGSAWSMLLLRTNYDYAAAVGDGSKSNIVMACVGWIARTFPEAPVRVMRQLADGQLESVAGHAMLQLLARPNRFYSGILLWMATLMDWTLSGNAYWVKLRNGQGRPVELWWVPSAIIEPKWDEQGTEFISHYEYAPRGLPLRLEVADVVHFRYGIDPLNTRKGLSPLASLLREIFTDEEAANFGAALLKNLGIPGVIIAPDDPTIDLGPEEAEAIKADFKAKFGGDKRGEPMVLSGKVKAQVLSFSPQQMDMKALRRLPEERISAVIGIPAIVAGLGAGLDRSTFANMSEAREMAYESNIIPTQRLLAAELQTQLLPDFDTATNLSVIFDVSNVRVLQEDQNKLWDRMDKAVRGGWVWVSTAKRAVGLPVEPGDDVYLRGMAVEAVGPGAPAPEPLPAPAKGINLIETKGRAASTRVAKALQRIRLAQTRKMRGDLGRYFDELAEAVIARAGKGFAFRAEQKDLPTVEDLLNEADDATLEALLKRHYAALLENSWETWNGALGLDLAFDVADPMVAEILSTAGTRIRQISETTRGAVQELLAYGADQGWGIDELVEGDETHPGLRQLVQQTYKNRARTIARTELGTAQNAASHLRYEDAGVERVLVLDGGTEDSDEDCNALNGTVQTLDWAKANPLGHPNCVRAIAPYFD